MSALVVIPARGGSRGVPRKNVLPVGGRPLLAWTVLQALAAQEDHPDLQVAVSTEDAEIAAAARTAGARVIERPVDLAQDATPTEPVVLHAMDVVEAEGTSLDAVILLQATSPVRRPDTISRALRQFRGSAADSLVGVVPSTPFFWHLPETEGAPARADYDVTARPRRQDLQPTHRPFFENGSLYVTAPRVYREHGNRIGTHPDLFVLEDAEGIDIDSPSDVAAAEAMLARLGWSLP